MNYSRLTLVLPDEWHEFVIAELFDLDFEGFEEYDDQLIASIPAQRFDDTKRQELELILHRYSEEAYIEQEEIIEPQNWNSNWEKSIRPLAIGRFYVRPTWGAASADDDEIELIIDPKMAFGTGYHATTRLMLNEVSSLIKPGDAILDAGTGTGILGIASMKLGAGSVFGFDIDEWSKENAEENKHINHIRNFDIRLGSIEQIPPGSKYDGILANINRNALIELLPNMMSHLNPGGWVLLSGVLVEDEAMMLEQPSLKSFRHLKTSVEGEWIAMTFRG